MILSLLVVMIFSSSIFAAKIFLEVENQNIEVRDGRARDPETKEWVPVDMEITWILWDFGQSDKALQVFEGSGLLSNKNDRGIAIAKSSQEIPAGTYDVWYRIAESGRDWTEGNLRYAWIEWQEEKTEKEDLVPFVSVRPRRVFGDWVKIADRVKLPKLKANELSFMLEISDTFSTDSLDFTNGSYRTLGWDAICLSDDPNFIPPSTVPSGGWEKLTSK